VDNVGKHYQEAGREETNSAKDRACRPIPRRSQNSGSP